MTETMATVPMIPATVTAPSIKVFIYKPPRKEPPKDPPRPLIPASGPPEAREFKKNWPAPPPLLPPNDVELAAGMEEVLPVTGDTAAPMTPDNAEPAAWSTEDVAEFLDRIVAIRATVRTPLT